MHRYFIVQVSRKIEVAVNHNPGAVALTVMVPALSVLSARMTMAQAGADDRVGTAVG